MKLENVNIIYPTDLQIKVLMRFMPFYTPLYDLKGICNKA